MMLAPEETSPGPRSYVHAFFLSAPFPSQQDKDWLEQVLKEVMSLPYRNGRNEVEVTWDGSAPTLQHPGLVRQLTGMGLGVRSSRDFWERNWIDDMFRDVQARFSSRFPAQSLLLLARHLHSNPNPSATVVDSMLVVPFRAGVGTWVMEPVSHQYVAPVLGTTVWSDVWDKSEGLNAVFNVLFNRRLGGCWEIMVSEHRQHVLEASLPTGETTPGRSPRL